MRLDFKFKMSHRSHWNKLNKTKNLFEAQVEMNGELFGIELRYVRVQLGLVVLLRDHNVG